MSGIAYPDEHYLLKARFREDEKAPEAAESLAIIDQYEQLLEKTRLATTAIIRARVQPPPTIYKMTKRRAILTAFRELGAPLSTQHVYAWLKEKGHFVASLESVRVALARYPEFKYMGQATWEVDQAAVDALPMHLGGNA